MTLVQRCFFYISIYDPLNSANTWYFFGDVFHTYVNIEAAYTFSQTLLKNWPSCPVSNTWLKGVFPTLRSKQMTKQVEDVWNETTWSAQIICLSDEKVIFTCFFFGSGQCHSAHWMNPVPWCHMSLWARFITGKAWFGGCPIVVRATLIVNVRYVFIACSTHPHKWEVVESVQ